MPLRFTFSLSFQLLSLPPPLYLSIYLSLSPSLSLLSIILFGVSNGRFRPCLYIGVQFQLQIGVPINKPVPVKVEFRYTLIIINYTIYIVILVMYSNKIRLKWLLQIWKSNNYMEREREKA